MSESQYVRISKGLSNYSLEPINTDIQKIIDKNPDLDYYESLYQYNEDHYNTWKQKKTVSGFTGVVTNKLVFDFDSKEDINLAKTDAQNLCATLLEKGLKEKEIQVYFSGNKGFHVQLTTDQKYSRKELENTIKSLGKGLKTLDTKITDEQRLIRIPMTKHPKTKLLKIPLTVNDLNTLSSSEIQKMAGEAEANPDKYFDIMDSFSTAVLPNSIKQYKIVAEIEKPQLPEIFTSQDMPDFSNKPKFLSAAKYALLQGFFEDGERHDAVMILASTFRGLGFPKEIAKGMLNSALELHYKRTGLSEFDERELEVNVLGFVYGPRWQGGTYSDKETPLLVKTIEKYKIVQEDNKNILFNLTQVDNTFSDFAQNIDKNTLKIGIKSLDERIRITTSSLVCLLAAPSAGKSSISFGVLNTVSNNNIPCLFFSLDMAAPMVYQRLIQRHLGYHSDKIFNVYKNKDKFTMNKIQETLKNEYKNVKFCFKSGLTVQDIRESIIKEKELTGEYPKLVVIDYLECVQSPFSDPTAGKAYVASNLKDIANEFGLCVFLLVQPQKSAGDPSYELNSYRKIKGSSVIEEAASQIFTIYRPGFNPKSSDDDKFMTITVVKNRMGELASFDYAWEGLRGAIRELTHEEENDLKALREDIEKNRSVNEKYSNI